MKKLISFIYHFLTWAILLVLLLLVLLFFVLESPSSVLKLLEAPLKEEGITYSKLEGGILSGFVLSDVNYQNKVRAKSVALKVDLEQLENRVLVIENLSLEELQIDKDFLASLLELNSSSEKNETREALELPFDQVIVKHLKLSLKNTSYEKYHVNFAELKLKNFKSDMKKKHIGELSFVLKSNVSQVDLRADFKDEKYVIKGTLEGEQLFLKPYIEEQELVLLSNPKFLLEAKGDMKKLNFKVISKALDLKQKEYELHSKLLDVEGVYDIENQKFRAKVSSNFDSNVATLKLSANAFVKLDDVNNSLVFDTRSDIVVYESFLNPLLKESNITLEGDTKVHLTASGTFKKLKAKVNASSIIMSQGIRSKVLLDTKDIHIDLETEQIKGGLAFKSDAKNLALNLQSDFSGNYVNPKNLKSHSKLQITKFNAFSVNLTQFMPMNLEVDSSHSGAKVNLKAKKLLLKLESSDYDKLTFLLQSGNIYLDKIMELPPALKEKFVKLDLRGDARLSKQYFSAKGWLKSNKKFKVKIDALSAKEGLNARLSTKHLKVEAKGNLKTKEIKASVQIDSLLKVQKEFQSLYPFTSQEIDGALQLEAEFKGEALTGTLSSSKLKFKDFAIEDLKINADYAKELITVNKLNLKMTGFKKKELNIHYYLNQKGRIHLGTKREVFLDIHPKILIKARGTAKNLKARIQVEDLPLGHPEYGDVRLSCDIDYLQEAQKKRISGGVFLDKLKLHYESKFMDPSLDNDVIIINKKDKNKKEDKDSFLNDMAIDLFIYASDGNYKTRDIDLIFNVNVKAKKEFKKSLVMLGKVEEITGRVEQAPKLFTVVDSNIVFKGEDEINPLLDLEVEYELPDVLITINIHGSAKRPKLTFSSEPPLPKKDILSYLLLGVSTANLAKGEGSVGREAQLFIMNQAARDLAYEAGLDRVFIKDDGTGEGYAVQAGKKIRDDTLFVIENSQEGNSFILEYEVSKDIKVEVGQHQKIVPSQSIDIFFRKKFK